MRAAFLLLALAALASAAQPSVADASFNVEQFVAQTHHLSSLAVKAFPDLKNFGRLPPLAADADVQFLQTQEQAANTATEVGNLVTIPNAGEQLRNGVPRFGNPKDFSSVMDGGDKAMQYGIGVAIQAAYGIVLFIITLLSCFCFCICRCCKCCGCDSTPDEKGYTNWERWGLLGVMSLFVAVSVVFSAIGFVNNNGMSTGISGPTGISASLNNLMGNTTGLVSSLVNLLSSVGVTLNTVIPQVQSKLNILNMVNGVNNLGTSLTTLGTSLGTTVTGYQCPMCQAMNQAVQPAQNQIAQVTSSNGPIGILQSTMTTINSTLVGIAQSIGNQINSSKTMITDASKSIVDYKSTVKSGTDAVNDGDKMRNLGVLILLLLPCVSVVVIIIGGLCKLGFLFTLNYLILYLACMLMFLLFTIHLPIAVVLADVCGYSAPYMANLSKIVPGQAGKIVAACLDGTSLIDVYDMRSQLNFTSAIKFSQLSVHLV